MGPGRRAVATRSPAPSAAPSRQLRRLSSGASRVTSAFDLVGRRRHRAAADPPAGARRGSAPGEPRSHRGGPAAGGRGRRGPRARASWPPARPPVSIRAGSSSSGWRARRSLAGCCATRSGPTPGRTDAQCARALAAVHAIDPDRDPGPSRERPPGDPLPSSTGSARSARLEFGVRWLECNRRTPGRRTPSTATSAWGTSSSTARASRRPRLGARPRRRPGRGPRLALRASVALRRRGPRRWLRRACRRSSRLRRRRRRGDDAGAVRWWEAYAAVKWAVICALQASAHLSGATRSVELAAIGRRVCESEWDLLLLLGARRRRAAGCGHGDDAALTVAPFGRPTAAELVEAVREQLEATRWSHRRASPLRRPRRAQRAAGRRARAALGTDDRRVPRRRLACLGYAEDAALASSIRSGAHDHDPRDLGRARRRRSATSSWWRTPRTSGGPAR